MKISKAKLNYFVDLIIGVGFLPAAVTGIVFLFVGSGGYQGGRNPRYMTQILSLSREVWKDVHTWSSLVMVGGVALHFVLHWNWLVCMTRRSFKRKAAAKTDAAACEARA